MKPEANCLFTSQTFQRDRTENCLDQVFMFEFQISQYD